MAERPIHTIDGIEFEFEYLNPFVAVRVLTLMGNISSGFFSNPDADISAALSSILTSLKPDDVEIISRTILGNVSVKTEKGACVKIEPITYFSGKIGLMMKVVAKGLEVNFKSFLDEIKEKLGVNIKDLITQVK